MDQFKDKIAVVTGAGSGIGRALARHCAAQGMRLAVADLHGGRLDALKEQLEANGVTVMTQALDVSDSEAVAAFAQRCEAELGVPDLLFNNAGILRAGETWSHSADDWQTMFSINVMGVVNGINAFVPKMLAADKAAHVINTGSVGSLVAATGMAQYTAAKMAVRGISECLLNDFDAQQAKIGVSLLCPGPVLTSISDDLLGIEAASEVVESEEHMMAGLPDFLTPDDVAQCTFDAIRENRFWIFTHPFNTYLGAMHQAIVDGQNPAYTDVTFD
ncbi:MAG: SDR family NAD(P)-dependent oxidoreductase [Halioglobus sp.]